MEERSELQGLHRFMQFCIYLFIFLDIFYFILMPSGIFDGGRLSKALISLHAKMGRLIVFDAPLYSRIFILVLISLVSMGTLSKKKRDLSLKKHIVLPLCAGIVLLFSGLAFFNSPVMHFFGFTLSPEIP